MTKSTLTASGQVQGAGVGAGADQCRPVRAPKIGASPFGVSPWVIVDF
jgi:hypothetical protein